MQSYDRWTMSIDPADPIYALRQQLASEISRSLGGSTVAASYYGIPQPRLSELSRGIVDRCTVEWLIRRIYRLGGSVTFQIEVGDAQRAWRQTMFRRAHSKNGMRRQNR
jgi:predicted XRE-type DNA-binding protein